MRKTWVVLVVVVAVMMALIFAMVGCPNEPDEPDLSLDRVRNSGTLVIGMDPSYPPFETYDGNGQLVGFDIELSNALAQQLGVQASFAAVNVDGMVDALIAKKVDVGISSLSPFPEHKKFISSSTPYFDAGQVIVVLANTSHISSVEDLKGHNIAVERGSIAAEEMTKRLKTLEGTSLLMQMTGQDALKQVLAGHAEAAVVDAVTALQVTQTEPGLSIVGKTVTDEPLVVLARRKDQALLTEINRILLGWHNNGFLTQLSEKWL